MIGCHVILSTCCPDSGVKLILNLTLYFAYTYIDHQSTTIATMQTYLMFVFSLQYLIARSIV